jgi:hypothetical protein
MAFNRRFEAFMAADRIMTMAECAGVDFMNPQDFVAMGWSGDCPDEMMWNNGASRLVIWDSDYCDYVIKIALAPGYEKYCQHEVEVYEAAVREGFADQFAWCACYQEPVYGDDGFYTPGIYVMEYVDCDEEAVYDSAWMHGYRSYCEMKGLDSSSYDHMEEYNDWNYCEDDDMVLDCIEASMDEDTKRAFCVFMMKWWITDIHTQNAGFKGNKMVIVDYAGWNW